MISDEVTKAAAPNPLASRKSGRPSGEYRFTEPSGVMEFEDEMVLEPGEVAPEQWRESSNETSGIDSRTGLKPIRGSRASLASMGVEGSGDPAFVAGDEGTREGTGATRADPRAGLEEEEVDEPTRREEIRAKRALTGEWMVAPEGVTEVRARVAPLWRRLLAGTVDLLVLGTVVGILLVLASWAVGSKSVPPGQTGLDALVLQLQAWEKFLVPVLAVGVLLAIGYSVFFAINWEGRTLGRRLFGIRLVDASGLPPAPTRAVARALLAVVSGLGFLGGFWWALFDRRGQTLHDKLTRTYVVQPVEDDAPMDEELPEDAAPAEG